MTTRLVTLDRSLSTHVPWRALALLLGAALGAGLVIQPVVVVVLLVGIVAGVFMLARPETATYLAIGLIYSNAVVVATQFHGLPQFAALLVPMLFLLPIGYRVLVRREPIVVTGALPFVALYLIVHLLSAVASGDVVGSLEEVSLFLTQGFLLYILVVNALPDLRALRTAVWVVLLVGGVLGGLPVLQQVTGTADSDYFGFAQTGTRVVEGEAGQPPPTDEDVRLRTSGPIGERNRFAQILIVLVPLGLFRFWHERSNVLRLLALGSTAFITIGVMMTLSRGAAVGFAVLLLALATLRYLNLRQVALVLVALAVILATQPFYVERLFSLEGLGEITAAPGEADVDPVLQQRANDMLAAGLAFIENPIVGVGPGRFSGLYQEYGPRVGGIPGEGNLQAHSLYPGIAAELGLAGLIVFSAILLVTIRDLIRARRLLGAARPELTSLVTSFLLAVLVYLGTSIALHMSYQRFFWMLMAMAGAAAYVALREARQLRVPEPSSGLARIDAGNR